jgi:4-hydroxybenzoate polyprenyltransferase
MTKNKYKMLLLSSRPISWINTAFPFAAAYLVTGGELSSQFWLMTFYFLIPYNMLVYVVNDVFDYESDLRNPRKGGVEGALVPPRLHPFMLQMVRLANVPFLLVFCIYSSVATSVVLLMVVIGALVYSVPKLRFKERPVLDSITSSFHFVGPALVALSITGWRMEHWPYLLAFFFWGMASHAFGAVQDINADRQANIHSIATQFGAKHTVRFAWVLYLVVAGLLFSQGIAAVAVGMVALVYAAMVSPYLSLQDKHAERANAGWKHFLKLNQIAGFVVTITLILVKT